MVLDYLRNKNLSEKKFISRFLKICFGFSRTNARFGPEKFQKHDYLMLTIYFIHLRILY